MSELNQTITFILSILGAVSVIGGGTAVISRWLSPYRNLKEKVPSHDKMLDNDNKRLKDNEEADKIICRSLLALLDHEITGNSVEKLKKTKVDLQNFLIDK
ncbi:CTP synthase [Anaerolentibacter hominis]|uniref:CTP synthase n=1 Tax=Anaerolentibacter hominis TaxID=3079009 RepID=UPI0031B84456